MPDAFYVEVITTKRDDPNYIHDRRTINYSNSQRRKWLAGHSNWALRNGFAVHTAAATKMTTQTTTTVNDEVVHLTRGQLRAMCDRIINQPVKLTSDQIRHARDQIRDAQRRYRS